MSDTARLLLTFAVLSASGATFYVQRLGRLDRGGPDRLIGQLRLAQAAAVLLAATGGVSMGLGVAGDAIPAGTLDVSIGVVCLLVAGWALGRDPRSALGTVAAGFVLHALADISHRPGLLSDAVMPRWFAAGCAIYDVYLAALCYWAQRR